MSSTQLREGQEASGAGDTLVLRWLVWLYFWLLILEGPLRKWLLPQFSNPLLLVRDPVAAAIYLVSIWQGVLSMNLISGVVLCIGAVASVNGVIAGTGNMFVTLYGFDASFFHIPLIFVIGSVFRKSDVVRLGKYVLLLCIPTAILMVVQFRSHPNAFVNFGPGAIPGSQMQAVLGRIRPPGLFNFITGAAQYLSLCAAFLVYGLLQKTSYNRMFLLVCGIALIVSMAVSTSRLVLGGIGLVFLMIGIIALYYRPVISGVVSMLFTLGLAFFVATNLDVFHEGRYVFEARLANTGEAGAGFARTASNWTERVLGDFLAVFKAIDTAPQFGWGLGYGTNVGSRILTGKVGFSADEREWGRIVLEIGPFLGVPYLLARIAIFVVMFRAGAESARRGNVLPLLLVGSFGLSILNGQFSVASTVGFTILGCGLCLAANNDGVKEMNTLPRGNTGPETPETRRRVRVAAAPYAKKLHEQ